MSYLRNEWSISGVVALFLCSVQGQNLDSCSQRDIVVNVRDQQGKFIDGLRPSSFRATLLGRPVKILSSRVRMMPPRIVLLLDVSGSVNLSNHKLERARLVAENFVVASGTPNIALVLFSDHIIDVLGFDRSPKDILQRLMGLTDGRGPTALLDSLVYSIDLFHAQQPGDAIFVISDGGDNHSKTQEKDVERMLLSRSIRLFPYVLSSPSSPSEEEVSGTLGLMRLAEVTGGSIVNVWQDQFPKVPGQTNASILHAYDLMKSFYELEVLVPIPEVQKEHGWELQIIAENGKRRKDVSVLYPRKLGPCSASNHAWSAKPKLSSRSSMRISARFTTACRTAPTL